MDDEREQQVGNGLRTI